MVRQTLVASQIALATLLLGGSALLVRSLDRLQSQDAGYARDHLAVIHYSFDARPYNTAAEVIQLGAGLLKGLQAIPGVIATPTFAGPLIGDNFVRGKYTLPDETGAAAESRSLVPLDFVGPDFFKVFGIGIVRGRAFTAADDERSERVMIVSESVARRYWPGQDPIGKRLLNQDTLRTVVGVARDTHLRDVHHSTPMIFLPWRQGSFQGVFALRTAGDLGAVLPALREAGKAVDPTARVWSAQTMDELIAEPMAPSRLSALLMSAFGLVALTLAAIGLYGVMTSFVRDQTREIGIRVALGASSRRVSRDILGRASVVIVSGALIGLAIALATSSVLRSLLFNVSPTDPISLGGATLLLVIVGIVAAYLPARRATRVDPVQALRSE